ncbi:hypothetical protein HAX54_048757, partial [Datura stramonium]|nr:hypothetical protein [Datura stramonium]
MGTAFRSDHRAGASPLPTEKHLQVLNFSHSLLNGMYAYHSSLLRIVDYSWVWWGSEIEKCGCGMWCSEQSSFKLLLTTGAIPTSRESPPAKRRSNAYRKALFIIIMSNLKHECGLILYAPALSSKNTTHALIEVAILQHIRDRKHINVKRLSQ